MFVYCGNNPISYSDPSGMCYYNSNGQWCHDNWEYLGGYQRKSDPKTFEEISALNGGLVTSYKGIPVIRVYGMKDAAFSYGVILLGSDIQANSAGIQTLRHEFGHTVQLKEMGIIDYSCFVVVPSVICFNVWQQGKLDMHYYSLPWEFEADMYGGVQGRSYEPHCQKAYYLYKFFVSLLSGEGVDLGYASRIGS